jgi:predicted nucleotide-binding protein
METGIAIGMNGGIRKLIILQMYDDQPSAGPDRRAELPSNFDGVLTLRFKERMQEVFDDLKFRLQKLKVHI